MRERQSAKRFKTLRIRRRRISLSEKLSFSKTWPRGELVSRTKRHLKVDHLPTLAQSTSLPKSMLRSARKKQ